jgi:YD repeat-containing protein
MIRTDELIECLTDSKGNILYDKHIGGLENWYYYDTNGKLVHSVNNDGQVFCYDAKGNQIEKSNVN